MINFIKKHRYAITLAVFIALYVTYFTAASFLRYDNFFTGRFDLGNMDQTVWNTIHGRIFQLTDPNGTTNISRLAFHADFILVLIAPLYLIWSHPEMLLLLQTIVLGLGAVFVYFIAKNIVKNRNVALVFSAAYLVNPALQYTNLYDFHAIVLGTTLLLATFYFFLKKKYLLFLAFAILAGITKEDIWAITAIFGLAIIVRTFIENKLSVNFTKKQLLEILLGLITFLTSGFLFYLMIWILIPHARGGDHFALSYYSDFGGSASDISKNILLKPLKTISLLVTPININYLFQLLLPFGFISLLSPLVLIFAAPDLLINLLGTNSGFHQIYYQYTAAISPFLIISAIYGVVLLKRRFPKINNRVVIIYLILTAVTSAYFYGPLPGATHASLSMFNDQISNRKTIDNFLMKIPTRYSIAASNNLGSHLSHRRNIYTIPIGIGQADVILFLLNDEFAQPSLNAQKAMVKQMSNDKNYIQIYKNGDFVAFEKRTLYTQDNIKPKKGQVDLFPYSIVALSNRSYQSSDVSIEKELSGSGNFKSYIISFTADGLKEFALMNIPNTVQPQGGFPILIVDHGYIKPETYDTVNSYKSETDYFANQGFLVLKPDFRGNGNSEVTDPALMRFGYPIDVLTLIASLDNIPQANKNQISLWSHSMGGEITLEVLEILKTQPSLASGIKSAAFWAPVTDPVKWFSRTNLPQLQEALITPYPYTETFKILGTPESNSKLWQSLSPLNYLKDINIPILLQHGTGDTTVPYEWSIELNNNLLKLNKNVQFISYPNDNHNLPLNWNQAISEDVNFFKSH